MSGRFCGHFRWTLLWDVSWELSSGVLEGLTTGELNPRGHGRSRGPLVGSHFALACSVRRSMGLSAPEHKN